MNKIRRKIIFIFILVVWLTAAIDSEKKLYAALGFCIFIMSTNYIDDRNKFFKKFGKNRSDQWIAAFFDYVVLASLILYMCLAVYYKVWSFT